MKLGLWLLLHCGMERVMGKGEAESGRVWMRYAVTIAALVVAVAAVVVYRCCWCRNSQQSVSKWWLK
jgi:hypothetical protein